MASFSARILGADILDKAMAEQARRVDRATMYGIRETGRQVKRVAKREAPVYKGGLRGKVKKTQGPLEKNAIDSGRLKRSIGQSRRLKKLNNGEYVLKVWPAGREGEKPHSPHQYAARIEATKRAFMKAGYDHALEHMRDIQKRAWERAMRR